jgi:hypothetical protein
MQPMRCSQISSLDPGPAPVFGVDGGWYQTKLLGSESDTPRHARKSCDVTALEVTLPPGTKLRPTTWDAARTLQHLTATTPLNATPYDS